MRFLVFLIVLFLLTACGRTAIIETAGVGNCLVHDYVDSTADYGSEYVYLNDSMNESSFEELLC